MKLELKRISLWSTIKVSFFVNLALGFILGCFYAPFFALFLSIPLSGMPEDSGLDAIRGIAGIAMIAIPFVMAIFSAIFNTIIIFLATLVYNLIGKTIGGLEFEFSEVKLSDTSIVAPVPTPIPTQPAQSQSPYSPFQRQAPPEPPQDYQL